jgi:hypothetical protein
MNTKVKNAVNRLNKILPLAERQQNLNPEISRLYKNILSSYVELGAVMTWLFLIAMTNLLAHIRLPWNSATTR